MKIDKGAINSDLPINSDEGLAWDSGAAVKNVKAWASDSDGNIDFGKYRKAFFWVDPENTDKQGGYKLPFANVFDGELKAVWRGVAGAMAALNGSRGGVDIPDNDRKPVYNAISKYYDKFDKEPPEFKEIDGELLHTKAYYDPETKMAVASTDSLDRMGEVIDQTGWDLKNFKKNPVILWAHDDRSLPIGTAEKVKIDNSQKRPQLVFQPIFHEITEQAAAVKAMYEQGILNSFSVGFLPLEMDGNTYTKQELLEISAVNVPANPDARTMAFRSLVKTGISTKVAAEVANVVVVNMNDEVLDKHDNNPEHKGNSAKEPSSAPKRKNHHEERLAMAKILAKAADILNRNEKLPDETRKSVTKVIKRASDIMIEQHKGGL